MIFIVFYLLLSYTYCIELGGILCSLPKSIGYECSNSKPHTAYYFNIQELRCKDFQYLGCGGSANRHISYVECMNSCQTLTKCPKGLPLMDFGGNIKRCDNFQLKCSYGYDCIDPGPHSVCCKSKENICSLPVESGKPCDVAPVSRYYYDSSSNICRAFISYQGCGGANYNNFESNGACLEFCASEIICLKGDPQQDRHSPSRPMRCINDSDCTKDYYCYGKSNNKACCLTYESICKSKFITNYPCRATMDIKKVWTFNYKSGLCEEKNEIVCLEQINSFKMVETCVDFCIGSCSNKKTQINIYTNQPQLCDFKAQKGCKVGYECVRSNDLVSICCKSDPVCPSKNSVPYSYPLSLDPINCDPNTTNSCPFSFLCEKAKNGEYICCTPKIDCPPGMELARQSNNVQFCNPKLAGSCQNEDTCVPVGANMHGCCKSQKKCLSFYVNKETRKPKKCFPGETKCPDSTECLEAKDIVDSVSLKKSFFCCYDINMYNCPNLDLPVMNKTSGIPISCDKKNECPSNHKCDILFDNSYGCCPIKSIIK